MTVVRAPEYWPGLRFFALAGTADRLVVADTLQYSRQSRQNRARLRTPQGWQWVSIPLKGRQHGLPICDVEIHGKQGWIGKHWRALHYNYRTTPYFDYYEPEIAPIFERDWSRLGSLTCTTVAVAARLLRLDTPILRASELRGRPTSVDSILEAADGTVLVVPPETVDIDRRHASQLRVVRFEPFEYRQNFDGFEPEMSVLDLLFNYGPESLSMIRAAAAVGEVITSG